MHVMLAVMPFFYMVRLGKPPADAYDASDQVVFSAWLGQKRCS